jgi:hypothetical protein
MTCRPKEKGGLGILDLERLARALRLRWLWFQWKHTERAWNGLDLPVDRWDKELFATSTVVTIGDGKKGTVLALFLGGRCNSEKYCSNSVQERKKKKIVSPSGTEREPWIAHISPLIRPQEIKEYVALRELVGHTKLQENMEDSIRWCWTTDGEYTAKSAYLIQFQGTFSKLKLMPIWKAKAEPKCGFFAWMLLHKKILTANNLIKAQLAK